MNNYSIYTGNVVTFSSRKGTLAGIVVRETIFAHCPGANSVTVLGEDGGLYGLPTCAGLFKTVAKQGDLDAARALYRAALSIYPVWAERFVEQGNRACGF